MNAALRLVLLALVLVNLVFVQITWSVGIHWLGPLYLLTVLSPFLVRVRESLIYRGFWNLGVLVIFIVLVHDATNTGVRYMLEDGLILAVFCQVHLLNNLGRHQKPDLLFFNSFLIALVTCFFSQDLVYFFVFLFYVPVLVVGLQLSCVLREGREIAPSLQPGLWREIVRRGCGAGFVALVATALAFLVVPRDFHREGLVGKHLSFQGAPSQNEIGFSEEVRLGRAGQTTQSTRIVLQVHLKRGTILAVPRHWRGATFERYSSGEWWAEGRLQQGRTFGDAWRYAGPGSWVKNRRGESATLEVVLRDPQASRLFAPLETRRVKIEPPADPMLGSALRDGTLRYARVRRPAAKKKPLVYSVTLHDDPLVKGGRPRRFGRQARGFVRVHESDVPAGAEELVDRVLRGTKVGAAQHVIVEKLRAHLANEFAYLLPGQPGAAESLEQFLAGEAGGHCEYFATALTILLRIRRIPCRLATGFLGTEWDREKNVLTVRSRDAHAWVEVYDPDSGWYTVDPTPAAATEKAPVEPSLLERAEAFAGQLWARITSFDSEGRANALAWLRALPGTTWSWCRRNPLHALGIVAAIAAFVWLRRRRRRAEYLPSVRSYLDVVQKTGLELEPSETPRELLARAGTSELAPESLDELAAATRIHEDARYGGTGRAELSG